MQIEQITNIPRGQIRTITLERENNGVKKVSRFQGSFGVDYANKKVVKTRGAEVQPMKGKYPLEGGKYSSGYFVASNREPSRVMAKINICGNGHLKTNYFIGDREVSEEEVSAIAPSLISKHNPMKWLTVGIDKIKEII